MRVAWRVVPLLLAACGGAPGGVDAGLPVDGGGPDAGRVDAGRPDAGRADAGPGEPRLSSAVLYADDFDAYVDALGLLAAYPDSRQRGATLSVDQGALRVDYAADGGCEDADVFVAKAFAGDVVELLVTVSFRRSRGFAYVRPALACGGGGVASTEFVLSRASGAAAPLSLEARAAGPGATRWVLRLGALTLEQSAHLDTRSPDALASEAWHRLTLFVSRESTAGQGDGEVRLWVDGVAVLEQAGVATGTAPFVRLALPTVLVTGAAAPQTRWLDDVAVFTP